MGDFSKICSGLLHLPIVFACQVPGAVAKTRAAKSKVTKKKDEEEANLPIQLPPPLPLLPSTPSPPLPPTGRKVPLVSQPLGAPFPESLLPLKDCPNPHFCVGGRNHVDFLRPGVGRDLPYREEVEWFTLR